VFRTSPPGCGAESGSPPDGRISGRTSSGEVLLLNPPIQQHEEFRAVFDNIQFIMICKIYIVELQIFNFILKNLLFEFLPS